jgi:HPt (histidine-containing phosphotransfer) domain-containing protein
LAQVQDWDALQLACHRIKGSAANLGLSGLAEAAAQLEVAARSQDMLRMQVSLREIEARIAATGCALEGAAE